MFIITLITVIGIAGLIVAAGVAIVGLSVIVTVGLQVLDVALFVGVVYLTLKSLRWIFNKLFWKRK